MNLPGTPPERLIRLVGQLARLSEGVSSRIELRSAPEAVSLGLALALRREALAWLKTLPASTSLDELTQRVRGADRRLAAAMERNPENLLNLADLEFDLVAKKMDEFATDLSDHPGEELDDLLDFRRIACELAILLESSGENRRELDRRLGAIDAQLRSHLSLVHRIFFGEQPRWIGDIPDEYWWLKAAEASKPT